MGGISGGQRSLQVLGVIQEKPPGSKLSVTYEGKGRKQKKRPSYPNNEVLGVLKSKREAYQPQRMTRTLLGHAEKQSGRLMLI